MLERVSTKDAAKELNICIDSLQYLLQHEQIPIGYAYKREKTSRYTYVIYRGLLDQYKKSILEG